MNLLLTIRHAGGVTYNLTAAEAAARFPPEVVAAAQAEAQADAARAACRAHIERHYPLWRQTNILRDGDAMEIAAMTTFIDACRDWSNGPSPDPAALALIQP